MDRKESEGMEKKSAREWIRKKEQGIKSGKKTSVWNEKRVKKWIMKKEQGSGERK